MSVETTAVQACVDTRASDHVRRCDNTEADAEPPGPYRDKGGCPGVIDDPHAIQDPHWPERQCDGPVPTCAARRALLIAWRTSLRAAARGGLILQVDIVLGGHLRSRPPPFRSQHGQSFLLSFSSLSLWATSSFAHRRENGREQRRDRVYKQQQCASAAAPAGADPPHFALRILPVILELSHLTSQDPQISSSSMVTI